MSFTPLETAAIALVSSLIVGICIKMWADNTYIKRSDCESHRAKCAVQDIRALKAMMRLVCEKLGISVEEQLRLEEQMRQENNR
jgi:hypothetical protein